MHLNDDSVTYFDSFGVEYIPKESKKFIGNKNITTIIYRIQGNYSIMCGYFCIGFIDFMLQGKILLGYTNSFPFNEYEKNDKIALKYFQRIKDFFYEKIIKKGIKIYRKKCNKSRKFQKR